MAPPPFSSAYHQPTSNISNTSTNGRTRQRSYASHSTPNTNDVNDTPPSAARRNRDTGVGSVSQRMSVISLSSPQPRVQYPQLPEGGKVRHTFYELPYWAQYEAVRVAVLCGFDCGGGEDALAAAALSEYFQELSVACLKMDNRVSWYQILGQFVEEHMGRGRTGGGLDVRRQSMGGSAKQRNMLTGMARVSENLWCQLQNYSWNNKVYMTGKILVDLPAQGTRREHPFTIRLNPLGSTSSNRFYRKFGSDRFLHLKLPQLSSSEYPRLEELVEFLFGGAGITLLGRTWRGIWVKEIKANRKKEKGASLQVILFATKGETIKEVIEVEDLIHWHMPLDSEKNLGLTVAKLWSRISLGFSDTNPTVCFDRDQICPSVEPRLPGEHYEPDDDLRNEINDQIGDIMDDGCSVASPAVMKRVAEILCLEEAPSAVQGRIGGAKGLWVVDPGALDEISQGLVDEDDLWIRVNKSQAKYEEHRICKDRAWKTLDVISSSKPPQPANMNLQLIPILEFRGVPFEPLRELVDEHLDMVLLELIEVQKEPVALRNWLQNRGCLSSFREYNEDLVWLGGLPAERYERLLMFVDSGFRPENTHFMQKDLNEIMTQYWQNVKEKLHIRIPQSTMLFCVADPTHTLSPGEVSLHFSTGILDKRTGRSRTFIEGDLLVARNPALLPSDIQKVTAVYNKHLREIKDVIVFSAQGMRSLVSMLSGGDYDGDKCWICWDSRIVAPFERESPEIPKFKNREKWFTQDKSLVKDLVSRSNRHSIPNGGGGDVTPNITLLAREFLRAGAKGFMTGSHSMLGYYCNQHTSHSSKWGISHSLSIELALICSTLVDAPKQGMSLTPYHYNRIRAYHNRYKSPPPQCEHRHGNLKRSLDDFVARKIEIMENDFSAQLKNTAAADTELTQGWKDVERSSVGDQPLKKCLDRLKTRLDKVQQMWCRRNGESAHRRENQRLKPGDLCRYETPRGDDDEGSSFTDIVEEAYSAYVAISPLPDGETESDHPVVKCWAMEAVKGNPDSPWALLKASCAFLRYRSSSFVWYMCGRQLCIIKAKAQPGGPRYICEEIYMSLKTPKKHVDARRLMRQGGGMRG